MDADLSPSLWLCAIYFGDTGAAVSGWSGSSAVRCTSRATPSGREATPGFFIQSLLCFLLMLGAFAGIVMRFVAE